MEYFYLTQKHEQYFRSQFPFPFSSIVRVFALTNNCKGDEFLVM